jgi:uncharacterized SAM-binding protein YcdF (DUF218 family)
LKKRFSFLFILLLFFSWYYHPLWLAFLGEALISDEQPFKADAIVVLAGDGTGERISRAVELVRQQWAPVIVVSSPGMVFEGPEGELGINWAVKKGAQREWFLLLNHVADSTREEAVGIAAECHSRGFKKVLLVTSDFHTHRAGMILRNVASGVELRTVASKTAIYNPKSWWKHRPSRKIWLLETTKTIADFVRM